jgi:hypothetical protein
MPCCSNPITTEGLTYESKDMVSLQKSPIDWNGGVVEENAYCRVVNNLSI